MSVKTYTDSTTRIINNQKRNNAGARRHRERRADDRTACVTLGSIETGGQSVLYRCHPRMVYDESVRKPLLDILGRWALHLMCDAEEA